MKVDKELYEKLVGKSKENKYHNIKTTYDGILFDSKKESQVYSRLKTMEKMDLYRASGIYPGKNLIFTYETEHNPLDIKGMRKMLIEMFCEGDT